MAALSIPAMSTAPTMSRTTVRLTARGRRLARTVVLATVLLLALVAMLGGRVPASQAGDGPAQRATTTVVVQPGQTLWSLAKSVAPGVDPRATIDRIKSLNGLSGSATDTVRPGQQLVIPAAG
jgi:hypothetical protein